MALESPLHIGGYTSDSRHTSSSTTDGRETRDNPLQGILYVLPTSHFLQDSKAAGKQLLWSSHALKTCSFTSY